MLGVLGLLHSAHAYFYVTFNFCLGVWTTLVSDPIFWPWAPVFKFLSNLFVKTYRNGTKLLRPNKPRHDKTNKMSVHPVKTQISLGICLSYPLSAQRRLWSDWADAQADLCLRWAHSHFVCFVMSWLKWLNRSIDTKRLRAYLASGRVKEWHLCIFVCCVVLRPGQHSFHVMSVSEPTHTVHGQISLAVN